MENKIRHHPQGTDNLVECKTAHRRLEYKGRCNKCFREVQTQSRGRVTSRQKGQKKHRGDGALQPRGLSINSDPGKGVNGSPASSEKGEETAWPKRRASGGECEENRSWGQVAEHPDAGRENCHLASRAVGSHWRFLSSKATWSIYLQGHVGQKGQTGAGKTRWSATGLP